VNNVKERVANINEETRKTPNRPFNYFLGSCVTCCKIGLYNGKKIEKFSKSERKN